MSASVVTLVGLTAVTSLSHWVSIFLYDTVDVTHIVARFVFDRWHLRRVNLGLHKVKLWDLWCGAGFLCRMPSCCPASGVKAKHWRKDMLLVTELLFLCSITNIGQQEKRAEGLHKHCRTTECDSSGNILQVRSVDTHAFGAPASWSNDDVQGALVFAESWCGFNAEAKPGNPVTVSLSSSADYEPLQWRWHAPQADGNHVPEYVSIHQR